MKKLLLFILIVSIFKVNAQKPLLPKFNDELKKWQYLDTNEKAVLTLKTLDLKNALYFTEGLAPVQDATTNLWGFINTSGLMVIKAQYDTVNFFLDNYAVVWKKCKTNCYKGEEGLLNDSESFVIDKTGKVMCQDNSQDERPYARFFLHENFGKGMFSIKRGIGLGERKDFMNYKGEILGETIYSFALNAIHWDEELKAIKCGGKYFDAKGNVKLDLSKYQEINSDFSNGYIWAISAIETETEYSLINVLVDSTGKEILNLSYENYTQLSPVEKGVFTYVDSKDNFVYSYTIKSNRIEKIKEYEFQFEELTEDLGYKHKDGSQIIYDIDTFEILGIQLKNGRKFYLKSTN